MDYVITNPNRTVYIKLSDSGQVLTCSENSAQHFTFTKATNILSCLPRHLHKFNFRVEEYVKADDVEEKMVLVKEDYQIPESVVKWMDKVNSFHGLLDEAKSRRKSLISELSDADRELSNCLHEIELSKNKSACDGYKSYKRMKKLLTERRKIKDEYSVVSSITMSNASNLYSNVKNTVEGLSKRKFAVRETDFVFDSED